MNTIDDFDNVPFVNEECGDTMWDETLLNQLSTPVTPETAHQAQLAEAASNSKDITE